MKETARKHPGKPHTWTRLPNVVDEQRLIREVEQCALCDEVRHMIVGVSNVRSVMRSGT